MKRPRIVASHSVDSIHQKDSHMATHLRANNPESRPAQAVVCCVPLQTASTREYHFQRVSRKLTTHYETVDRWKQKYKCSGSSDRKAARKLGLIEPEAHLNIITPKRRSVVQLPKLQQEGIEVPQRFSLADKPRSIKHSDILTAENYFSGGLPVHSFQILHQQPTELPEQPNSMFPEMVVGKKKLSSTITFKKREYCRIDEPPPSIKALKRRGEPKSSKCQKRPYFDRLLERMAEEQPTGWNYYEQEGEEQADGEPIDTSPLRYA